MGRHRKIGAGTIARLNHTTKLRQIHPAPAHPKHGARQCPHHPPQKTVPPYHINRPVVCGLPATFQQHTVEGLHLCIPLAETGEVCVLQQHIRSLRHQRNIKRIGEKISPVDQERLLPPANMIPVRPAHRIKAAMGGISYPPQAFDRQVIRQHRIQVVDHPVFQLQRRIKMKIVLQRMDPRIRAGRAGQLKL